MFTSWGLRLGTWSPTTRFTSWRGTAGTLRRPNWWHRRGLGRFWWLYGRRPRFRFWRLGWWLIFRGYYGLKRREFAGIAYDVCKIYLAIYTALWSQITSCRTVGRIYDFCEAMAQIYWVCILHKENLCVKNIDVGNMMDVVVKTVNFIRYKELTQWNCRYTIFYLDSLAELWRSVIALFHIERQNYFIYGYARQASARAVWM